MPPGLDSSVLRAPELDSCLLEAPELDSGFLGAPGTSRAGFWLGFGEHEALKRDLKRAGILIPAEGNPTMPSRLYPADGRETPLRRTPMGGSNALLASIWRT